MFMQADVGKPLSAHVIVLGNEKGGSGKSTTAMHVAVALLQAGQRVATIDLDSRQKSFTHYIENRRDWAERTRIKLDVPKHFCVARGLGLRLDEIEAQEFAAFADAISAVENTSRLRGDRYARFRLLHDAARPFDGRYADYADQRQFCRFRRARHASIPTNFCDCRGQPLRGNGARSAPPAPPGRWRHDRLDRCAQSAFRRSARATSGWSARVSCRLAKQLGFRFADGFAERVVYREFFPRGLTALDDINEDTLGMRPTMSHMTARDEVKAADRDVEAADRRTRQTAGRRACRMGRFGGQAAGYPRPSGRLSPRHYSSRTIARHAGERHFMAW